MSASALQSGLGTPVGSGHSLDFLMDANGMSTALRLPTVHSRVQPDGSGSVDVFQRAYRQIGVTTFEKQERLRTDTDGLPFAGWEIE
jgi:hypothetical protein